MRKILLIPENMISHSPNLSDLKEEEKIARFIVIVYEWANEDPKEIVNNFKGHSKVRTVNNERRTFSLSLRPPPRPVSLLLVLFLSTLSQSMIIHNSILVSHS